MPDPFQFFGGKTHRLRQGNHFPTVIVRDNHTFDDLKASGHYRSLITSFLLGGFDSEAYGVVIEDLGDAVWLE